jgi:hypothetical protein
LATANVDLQYEKPGFDDARATAGEPSEVT